jgi:predicted restriction endonuclease
MDNFQIIKIEDKEYYIIDYIENLRAEDSFIHNQNKLSMYGGSGEARKYVGSYAEKSTSNFFEYSNWGNIKKTDGKKDFPLIQENSCFFSKSNLLKYMEDAKGEYEKQEQIYQTDISKFYAQRIDSIKTIDHDNIFFSIYDVSDLIGNAKGYKRCYIRSNDSIWNIWRKLILPKISYLHILKLKPVEDGARLSKPLFYFRVFIDYQFRSINRLYDSKAEIAQVKKEVTTKKSTSRVGGQKFRKEVLDYMPQCPFTKVTDEKLLVASHIKPHKQCELENRPDQDVDYLNGLSLTPTYDYLFDQGYITFLNDGRLICGTLISDYTWAKLNINPNAKNKLDIKPEGREEYLEFHRKIIFRDNIDELT